MLEIAIQKKLFGCIPLPEWNWIEIKDREGVIIQPEDLKEGKYKGRETRFFQPSWNLSPENRHECNPIWLNIKKNHMDQLTYTIERR